MRSLLVVACLVGISPSQTAAQTIRDVRYTVIADSAHLQRRTIGVLMSFMVTSHAPLVLALPRWTPGHYAIMEFAKNVSAFDARQGERALRWNKVDVDRWRVQTGDAGRVSVSFEYRADSDDNASAMTHPDFVYFNGTNVFPYPVDGRLDFPATVTIKTSPEWRVATSMHGTATSGVYHEASYHDLVDMPVFIGRFDVDSALVSDRWTRIASYPTGAFTRAARDSFSARIARIIPVEAALMRGAPWDSYSILVNFDSTSPGYGALEHQASHLAHYGLDVARDAGTPLMASVAAHEIFHAWNVKRLRPVDLMPYRYDRAQTTPWLWVSEGITDYYADLIMMRAHVVDSLGFLAQVAGKIGFVSSTSPTALSDASVNSWIGVRDGSDQVYYPKGSLAGLMLDILIRDASDNRRSLDDVMRDLYDATAKEHRGFTANEWWSTVSKAAGGRSFAAFEAQYVSGRDAFPWDSVLPLAGLRYVSGSIQQARLGTTTVLDSLGQRVQTVVPKGTADHAHVQPGDYLVSVGGVEVLDANWSSAFRARYNGRAGIPIDIVVRRGGQVVTLSAPLITADVVERRIVVDFQATPKASRVRHGLFTGSPH